MRLSTQNCHVAGQQEIAFEIEPEASSLATWLLGYFESEAHAGTRFQDGQTVELGWTLLQLRQMLGYLEVYEPNFNSLPIQWCRGVNNAVRHLSLQRSVCGLFGCDPQFPSIRQAGIVSPNFGASRDFTMSRDQPTDSDSGWVFAENDYKGEQGEFSSLYQVALQKMVVVPFLALPEASSIRVRSGKIEITVGGQTRYSESCDLLGKIAANQVI